MSQRLSTEQCVAILAAAVVFIKTSKKATDDARKAIEPLLKENRDLRIQVEQLDAADAQLDEAIDQFRQDVEALQDEPTGTADENTLPLGLDGEGETGGTDPVIGDGPANDPIGETGPEGVPGETVPPEVPAPAEVPEVDVPLDRDTATAGE